MAHHIRLSAIFTAISNGIKDDGTADGVELLFGRIIFAVVGEGLGATKVKKLFAEFVPPSVVTKILAVPAEPAGETAIIVFEF